VTRAAAVSGNGDQPSGIPERTAAVPPAARAVAAAPAQQAVTEARAQVSGADVLKQLLHIVSERTGYPEDMLQVDANMEADLGIDSIKRMEILAAFQQQHAGAHGASLQEAMERLNSLKTIRESAAALTEILTSQPQPALA
jgi:hypothetical protein